MIGISNLDMGFKHFFATKLGYVVCESPSKPTPQVVVHNMCANLALQKSKFCFGDNISLPESSYWQSALWVHL